MTVPRTHFCTSASGRRFHFGVAHQPVNLLDIAAQLAKINRFAGGTQHFYSVAQHAVLVSTIVMSLPGATSLTALQALHHDDHEMVSSDIPVPFRLAIRDRYADLLDGRDVIAEMQEEIDKTIYAALGIPAPDPKGYAAALIHHADKVAYSTEIRDLWPSDADAWDWGPRPEAWKRVIKALPWAKAEDAFLKRHHELVALCGAMLADAA